MHISGVERGKRDLSLTLMRRLADVFGVSVADLLPRRDNPSLLSDDEMHLVNTYRQADDDTKENIQRVTDALVPFNHFPRNAA